MGLPKLFGGSQMPSFETRVKIPVVAMTEMGKSKLGTLETGDIKYRIMDAINSHGTADMQEIANSTALTIPIVRHHLTELLASGYIQIMNMRG